MENAHRRTSNQRWLERGWDSQVAATNYYRRVWQAALDEGIAPGAPLRQPFGDLTWLVGGHPQYAEMSRHGLSHFTFRPDGRGNHRFVFVDKRGTEHPFSTNTALTGFEYPLREPNEEDAPFRGLTS